MILYFRENFHILHMIFSFDKNGKPLKKDDKEGTKDPNEYLDNNPPWTITKVNRNKLSNTQQIYSRLFYWASFIGQEEICKMMMK